MAAALPTLHCSFCEHPNPVGAKFCNDCGSPLRLKPCARCDAINDLDATHCHQCGADFDEGLVASEADMPAADAPAESKPSVVRAFETSAALPARAEAEPVIVEPALAPVVATPIVDDEPASPRRSRKALIAFLLVAFAGGVYVAYRADPSRDVAVKGGAIVPEVPSSAGVPPATPNKPIRVATDRADTQPAVTQAPSADAAAPAAVTTATPSTTATTPAAAAPSPTTTAEPPAPAAASAKAVAESPPPVATAARGRALRGSTASAARSARSSRSRESASPPTSSVVAPMPTPAVIAPPPAPVAPANCTASVAALGLCAKP